MKNIIEKVLNAINLTPQVWMDGTMCLANEWIIELMLYGGTAVFVLYQFFATGCWYLSRNPKFLKIFGGRFFSSLAVVFHLCGLLHLAHVWAKVDPYWYSVGLFYFILVPVMVHQVYRVCLSIDAVKGLKTSEEVQEDRRDLTTILIDHVIADNHNSRVSLEKASILLNARGFHEQAEQITTLLTDINK